MKKSVMIGIFIIILLICGGLSYQFLKPSKESVYKNPCNKETSISSCNVEVSIPSFDNPNDSPSKSSKYLNFGFNLGKKTNDTTLCENISHLTSLLWALVLLE
jgi:hypothetical protein